MKANERFYDEKRLEESKLNMVGNLKLENGAALIMTRKKKIVKQTRDLMAYTSYDNITKTIENFIVQSIISIHSV